MEIPKVQAIQPIQPITPGIVGPITKPPTPGAVSYQKYLRERQKRTDTWFDYNNPDQVNSFADALGHSVGELVDPNGTPLQNITNSLKTFISESASVLWGSFVNPVITYGWDDPKSASLAILNNNFINGIETLDILANPVKAALLGKDVGDAFIGRQNYDYDFEFDLGDGTFEWFVEGAAELGAEALSDPITWATLGLGSVKSVVSKGILKPLAEQFAEEYGKRVGNKMMRNFRREFVQNFTGDTATTLIKMNQTRVYSKSTQAVLDQMAKDTHANVLLKSLRTATRVVDGFDSMLSKVGFNIMLSGSPALVKMATKPVGKYISRALNKAAVGKFAENLDSLDTIQFFNNMPDLIDRITSLTAIATELKDAPMEIVDAFASKVVKNDVIALNNLIKGKTRTDGESLLHLIDELDKYAAAHSGNMYQNFSDYAAVISNIHTSRTELKAFSVMNDYVGHAHNLYLAAKKTNMVNQAVDAVIPKALIELEKHLGAFKASYRMEKFNIFLDRDEIDIMIEELKNLNEDLAYGGPTQIGNETLGIEVDTVINLITYLNAIVQQDESIFENAEALVVDNVAAFDLIKTWLNGVPADTKKEMAELSTEWHAVNKEQSDAINAIQEYKYRVDELEDVGVDASKHYHRRSYQVRGVPRINDEAYKKYRGESADRKAQKYFDIEPATDAKKYKRDTRSVVVHTPTGPKIMMVSTITKEIKRNINLDRAYKALRDADFKLKDCHERMAEVVQGWGSYLKANYFRSTGLSSKLVMLMYIDEAITKRCLPLLEEATETYTKLTEKYWNTSISVLNKSKQLIQDVVDPIIKQMDDEGPTLRILDIDVDVPTAHEVTVGMNTLKKSYDSLMGLEIKTVEDAKRATIMVDRVLTGVRQLEALKVDALFAKEEYRPKVSHVLGDYIGETSTALKDLMDMAGRLPNTRVLPTRRAEKAEYIMNTDPELFKSRVEKVIEEVRALDETTEGIEDIMNDFSSVFDDEIRAEYFTDALGVEHILSLLEDLDLVVKRFNNKTRAIEDANTVATRLDADTGLEYRSFNEKDNTPIPAKDILAKLTPEQKQILLDAQSYVVGPMKHPLEVLDMVGALGDDIRPPEVRTGKVINTSRLDENIVDTYLTGKHTLDGLADILETIKQELDDFDMFQAVYSSHKEYGFNRSLVNNMNQVLEGLEPVIKEVAEHGNMYVVLQQIQEEGLEEAFQVRSTLEAMGIFNKMLNDLAAMKTVSDDVKSVFVDKLQSFKDFTLYGNVPERIEGNMLDTHFVKKLISETRQALASESRRTLALSAYADYLYNSGDKELLAFIGDKKAHNAAVDAYVTARMYDDLLSKHSSTKDYKIFVDIETTGMSGRNQFITQVGIHNRETGESILIVVHEQDPKLVVGPTKKLADKLYPTAEDSMALYEAAHLNGDVTAIEQHISVPGAKTLIMSEAEAIEFLGKYQEMDLGTMRKVTPVLHNGDAFDIPFINNRAKKYNLKEINAANAQDTLNLMRKETGLRHMTENEARELEQLVEGYLNARKFASSEIELAERFKTDLNFRLEHSHIPTFIPQLDKTIDNMNKIVEFMDRKLKEGKGSERDAEAISYFSNLSKEIFLILKAIGEQNDSLRKVRFGSETTNKPMSGAVETFYGPFNKAIDAAAEVMGKERVADTNPMAWLKDPGKVKTELTGIKKMNDGELLNEWFPEIYDASLGILVNERIIRFLTKTASLLDRVYSRITNTDRLLSMNKAVRIAELHDYASTLEEGIELLGIPKNSYETVRLKILTARLDKYVANIESMSDADYLQMYLSIRNTKEVFLKELSKHVNTQEHARILRSYTQDTTSIRYMHHESYKELFKQEEFIVNDVQYFTPSLGEDPQKIYDFYKELSDMKDVTIKDVEALAKEHKVSSAKLQMQLGIYDSVANLFIEANKFIKKDGEPAAPSNAAMLRKPFDELHRQMVVNALAHPMNMTPQELVGHLYHNCHKFMLFKNEDLLLSEEYILKPFLELKRNPECAALGIKFKEVLGHTFIILEKGRAYDVPPPKHVSSTLMYDRAKAILDDPEVSKLLDLFKDAHETVMRIAPDGASTTLEHLDRGALGKTYAKIHAFFGEGIFDDLWTIDQLANNQDFVGGQFNHSLLGAIENRRRWMVEASYNPAKNLLAAVSMTNSRLSNQSKVINTCLSRFNSLNGEFLEGQEEALFKFITESQGAQRLVFFADHKTKGSVIKSVHVTKMEDIDFAKNVGAFLVPEHVYTKLASMYNNNRIDIPLLNWIDKSIVSIYKVGYLLYSEGFLIRNIIDSTLKNIVDTGDPLGILGHTLATMNNYRWYKEANQEITRLVKENKYGDFKKGKDLFFKDPANASKLELYDLIHQFKVGGYSGGMSKELREFYGDASLKLYNRSGISAWGLKYSEFKELLHEPLDVAVKKIENQFPGDTHMRDYFRATHERYYFYKRAYAMTKLTQNRELTVDVLADYLMKPKTIKFHHMDEVNKLMDKTSDFKADRMAFHEHLMDSKPVRMWFDLNGFFEETFRLTNYTYHLKYNQASEATALHHVLRTHFDYSHKSTAMHYAEMLFPFMNFRLNNMMFWMDTFDDNPANVHMLAEYLKKQQGLVNIDHDERVNNRSRQWHTFAGNVILPDDSVFKLSPSVVDVINTIGTPLSPAFFVKDAAVAPVRMLLSHMVGEFDKKEWESDEDYETRFREGHLAELPVVGPLINRGLGVKRNLSRGLKGPRAYSSTMFSMLKPYEEKRFTLRMQKPRVSYGRNGYYAMLKYRRMSRRLTRRNYKLKVWGIGYNSSRGKSITKLLLMPKNKYTYKMHQALRRNRWRGRRI